MAQLGMNFDATTVAPQEPFSLLPAGVYPMQIIASDMRPTRDGNGQYLWLELEITDGEHKGRKTWDQLNLVNYNPQTQEIAQRTLSAICHATGQLSVSDSEDLHFKPMMVTVRVRPETRDKNDPTKVLYAARNEVRGYGAAMPPGAVLRQTSTQQAARPAAPAAPAKPWQRRAG